jgi:hypothetical protein
MVPVARFVRRRRAGVTVLLCLDHEKAVICHRAIRCHESANHSPSGAFIPGIWRYVPDLGALGNFREVDN